MLLADFYRILSRHPNRVAVDDGEKILTYTQLNDLSSTLAEELQKQGIEPGNVVGYWGSRSREILVVILAIWKVQAVFLPINEECPLRRARYICEQSQAKLVISCTYDCPIDFIDVLSLKKTMFYPHHKINTSFYGDNPPDSPAYILFTSGSTGVPKGVITDHKGLYNHLLAKKKILEFTQDSRVLFNSNIDFVISIWQQLLPLMVGSTVFVLPKAGNMHLHLLAQCLMEKKISILEVVPSFLSLLIRTNFFLKLSGYSLQYLVVTGEKFEPHLANACMAACPDTKIINAYGLTETSDDVAHYQLEHIEYREAVPIGREIDNIHISILKDNGEQALEGEIGTIVIKGIGVAQGYVHNVEETKKHFQIRDGASTESVYVTSDYGFQKNGLFYCCGRNGEFIKINGNRIEIAEIERALRECPVIEDAVVVVCENHGNNELHAYLKAKTEQHGIRTENIRAHLKSVVPLYMIPSRYFVCQSFPVNQNGKIDRARLSEGKVFHIEA